jgi:diamine N-acetyltransferase
MLRFEKITPDNYRECTWLKVAEHQTGQVKTVAKALAEAYAYYDTSRPYAVYNDGEMIGFLLLRELADLQRYYISQFMIDERYQGKGYGKQAMRLMLDMLKQERKYPRIGLCFNEGNVPVENLYTGLGFKLTGERDGPDVLMSFDLA